MEVKTFPPGTERIAASIVTIVTKRQREAAAIQSNEEALLSPLSLLVWGDESAPAEGIMAADATALGRMKTELKSSEAEAQFLDLPLVWNWTETFVLGPILSRLCFELKLTWATLSAVKSHEENSFSSRDGPREMN